MTGVPESTADPVLLRVARADQELRRPPGARRRRPRAARRPGARPGRRERRRQVDADEDPRRGLHQPDEGTIELAGEPVSFSHPVQAQQAGVSTVFQEFNLLPERTVAENVYLGREPRRRGLVDTARMQPRHRRAARRPRRHRPPARPAGALAQRRRAADRRDRQGGQLRRADHPDGRADRGPRRPRGRAALRDHRRLTARGVAILYVSHRLKEIFDLCDTITVLKDGQQVTTQPAAELDDAELVRLMVGRSISSFFPDKVARHRGRRAAARARAAPATGTSTASTSPCAPARSSASPGCRAPAAPSCSRRSSGSARSPAARCCSTASRCAPAPRAPRSAPGWP